MANSIDPDETARYEPSHQDLHCLHRYLFLSAGHKRLTTVKQEVNYLNNSVLEQELEVIIKMLCVFL